MKVVQGGKGILSHPGISEENFELCDVVLDEGVPLPHSDYLVKGVSLLVIQFERAPKVLEEIAPSSEVGFSLCGLLRLQTIKAIINSRRFKGLSSDEPRRVQVLDLYCLTRFESEGSGRGDVY